MKVNHSIILTVHNKGWLIDKVIQNIYKNTVGSYELIVILDGCTDNSEEVVLENVNRDATILYAANVFETTANNIGLRRATGEKVIIVQDDMVITEEVGTKDYRNLLIDLMMYLQSLHVCHIIGYLIQIHNILV